MGSPPPPLPRCGGDSASPADLVVGWRVGVDDHGASEQVVRRAATTRHEDHEEPGEQRADLGGEGEEAQEGTWHAEPSPEARSTRMPMSRIPRVWPAELQQTVK